MVISSAEEILIVKDLLIVMGLEIQTSDNTVIDQETKSLIKVDGKSLKANNDPEKALVISEGDIKLEPTNPRASRLMEYMFGKFLDDAQEMENLPEVLTYYFDRETSEDDFAIFRLVVKTTEYKWEGPWYYNKVLCYTDAIFSLDGTFSDKNNRLRYFDDPNVRNDDE